MVTSGEGWNQKAMIGWKISRCKSRTGLKSGRFSEVYETQNSSFNYIFMNIFQALTASIEMQLKRSLFNQISPFSQRYFNVFSWPKSQVAERDRG